MLIKTNQIEPNQVFNFDVCIIGAGAAGIALARSLKDSHKLIGVMESGSMSYNRKTQHLYRGNSQGPILGPDPTYLSVSRLRFFGGTMNQWKGWCLPLDPIDFEKRSWIPESGWPIGPADLEPHYDAAAEILGIKPFGGKNPEGEASQAEHTLPPDEAVETREFHVSATENFAQAHRDDLVKARNVNLFLGANCLEIVADSTGEHVKEVHLSSLSGKRFTARARAFVLATGAIENARLLLVSDKIQKKGLGNNNDLVGRYFMDHPHHDYLGHVVITDPQLNLSRYNPAPKIPAINDSISVLSISEKFKREHRLLNFCSMFSPLKARGLGEVFRRTGRALQCMDWMMTGKKIVYNQDARHARLLIRAEASPHRESRVSLIDDEDALGVRLPTLHWKVHKTDAESIRKSMEILAVQFGKKTRGRIQMRISEEYPWRGVYAANHHLGTTRMSDDPKTGVVDGHGKVHGLSNLYVAGGSVFPTSGMAHPTFTIVSLTLRMSDHLKKVLEA